MFAFPPERKRTHYYGTYSKRSGTLLTGRSEIIYGDKNVFVASNWLQRLRHCRDYDSMRLQVPKSRIPICRDSYMREHRLMLQHEHRLENTGETGRALSMANVRFDR